MNVLIIEDEQLLARELKHHINEIDNTIVIIDILPSLKRARRWFMENPQPDLIFMDVQLSDGISFSLFSEFTLSCPVIFTTAFDQYAVKAFKVNGTDYLLKPIVKEELHKAIEKSKVIINSKLPYALNNSRLLTDLQSNSNANKAAYKEIFMVQGRNQWLPINISEIACFYKDTLLYVYTFSGDRYTLTFESMDEIEQHLDPKQYYRANRHSLININSIHSIKPMDNAKVIITLKQPLKLEIDISRDKAPEFRRWLDR